MPHGRSHAHPNSAHRRLITGCPRAAADDEDEDGAHASHGPSTRTHQETNESGDNILSNETSLSLNTCTQKQQNAFTFPVFSSITSLFHSEQDMLHSGAQTRTLTTYHFIRHHHIMQLGSRRHTACVKTRGSRHRIIITRITAPLLLRRRLKLELLLWLLRLGWWRVCIIR